MKLSEAIAEIEKDHSKQFVSDDDYILKANRFCVCCVHKEDLSRMVDLNFVHTQNWQLVKPEPREVEFMEAVKAFDDFKTIQCRYGGSNTVCSTFKRNGNYVALRDTDGIEIGSEKILNMDWYILEDE